MESWPTYDEALCVEAEIEIPVQISGKVRARITLPADQAQSEAVMQAAAMASGGALGLVLFAAIGPAWTLIACGIAIFAIAVIGWWSARRCSGWQ